jgi:hypothetical protein
MGVLCKLLAVLGGCFIHHDVRWTALFLVNADVIRAAHYKLTNAEEFRGDNHYHVLAVLSQRLGLDPVLGSLEARRLADGSVARHMRLLTGISPDGRELHTHSPSEPALVLGAVDILYNGEARWRSVLNSLSVTLCKGAMVEKGVMGELAGRTLLLLARDYTAPRGTNGVPDVLQLVPVMDFLDKLFGSTIWCGKQREAFIKAFRYTYVNFTHWIVTEEHLPDEADE